MRFYELSLLVGLALGGLVGGSLALNGIILSTVGLALLAAAGRATIISIDAARPATLDESVLIRNDGAGAPDMSGWTLCDLLPNIYSFPAFTLAAGAEVRVWTTSGADDGANLFWNRGTAVWNNGGDTAILSDAHGVEQGRFSYP